MSFRALLPNPSKGFSLVELLVTVTLLALLIGIAMPSYNNFIAQKRLRAGAEDLYSFIRQGSSESLNQKTTVYLSFKTGANWCYGLNNLAACDCSVSNSCRINAIQTVIRHSDYAGEPLALAVTGFSGASTAPSIIFQGNLGSITVGGSIVLSVGGLSVTVAANSKGLITICSNTVKGYPRCT